jgi:hypothetical protein
MCYGATGALTRLRDGAQERIAVGFPSYISPSGEVTGAHDVSFLGLGGAYVTIVAIRLNVASSVQTVLGSACWST